MVDAVFRGERGAWGSRPMRVYGVVVVALVAVYPLLPVPWRGADSLLVGTSAVACVGFGRRAVTPGRRLPWTLLMTALVVILVADLVLRVPDERAIAVGWLLDAAGNVLALAAALALIIRRGSSDLGGIVDTTVVALAAGGLLWGLVLPHQLGADRSVFAQVNLFVVVFALSGVLGALLRLSHTVTEPGSALPWLMAALGIGIGANVMLAVAGTNATRLLLADVLFMAALAALGLFGLDPTGPRLAQPGTRSRPERLSAGRLAFLGIAVAVVPVVIGVRELLGAPVDGVLLAVQGLLVAALVMIRVGLLSAQRAQAEQALMYQAVHDPLTQLPNRRAFVERLGEELSRDTRCVLLFCDLDSFKEVNDRLGHAAGDELLIEVARRVRACAPAPHLVSRFGGDEFVVLLVDATQAEGEEVKDCIASAVARPFEQARGVTVGISIGVSPAEDTRDPEQAIRTADWAMYRVKAGRRPH